MSQGDQSVANSDGATVRADINAELQALVSLSSGASAPGTTWAGMLWYDTTNAVVKQRNAANSAWVTRWTVASSEGQFPDGAVGVPGAAFAADADNGAYRIGTNNWALAVAGAKAFELHPAGELTAPLQSAFFAYKSAISNNVTGNNENYLVIFDTEVKDYNADYNNATGVFTAPVTGLYLFCVSVADNADASYAGLDLYLNTSNRTFDVTNNITPSARTSRTTAYSVIADMDAGDTASVSIQIASGATIVDISGSAGAYTYFSGVLLC